MFNLKIQKVKHLHLEETKKNPDINYEYIVTPKIDGWYTFIDFKVGQGWSNVKSATGREIPSMLHCKEYFKKLPVPMVDCRFIMEAYIPETPFHILNGVFNRTIGDCKAEDAHFAIHDILYLDSLSDDNLERYKRLHSLHKYIKEIPKLTTLNYLTISDKKEEWFKAFNSVVDKGGEGVVLKRTDGIYQPGKRNSSLMKIKLEDTFDLLCIDMYETVGEKGGRNLNLKLKRKSGTELDVRVGKHADITRFLLDPTLVVGKVCEIKCMKELEKGGMLREPRFVAIRTDKTKEEID